jgi:hypothetical protein
MNIYQRRLRRGVAVAFLVGTIAAPAASAAQLAERTPTELGQAVGEPGERSPSADSIEQRTATELGQAVGEPGERSSTQDQQQQQGYPGTSGGGVSADTVIRRDGSAAVPFVPWVNGAPPAKAEAGFDWGDAGIGAGAMFTLIVIAAGAALATGHRPRRSVA